MIKLLTLIIQDVKNDREREVNEIRAERRNAHYFSYL